MAKILKSIFIKRILSITLFFILFFGCTKQENKTTEYSNSAEIISNSKRVGYGIKVNVGHSGSTCSGCVTVGGQSIHVDCQGSGNACRLGGAMIISNSDEDGIYYGTIENPDELTYEDFFLMPDRSLYIEGTKGQFLNIPEQMAYRDKETGTFIFYDIFFSDRQIFGNK